MPLYCIELADHTIGLLDSYTLESARRWAVRQYGIKLTTVRPATADDITRVRSIGGKLPDSVIHKGRKRSY